MPGRVQTALLLVTIVAPSGGLLAEASWADVPRACVHPVADPIRCAEQTRAEHHDLLPTARLRALEAQRRRLERRIPLQDAERNALLLEIREVLEGTADRR